MVLRPGTHVGYRFDADGGVTRQQAHRTHRRRARSRPTVRATQPGMPGYWLSCRSGGLDGYWVRESGAAGLVGKAGARGSTRPDA